MGCQPVSTNEENAVDDRQETPVGGANQQIVEMVEKAHQDGVVSVISRHGKILAAIIPVDSRTTITPNGTLDVTYDAAPPGSPGV